MPSLKDIFEGGGNTTDPTKKTVPVKKVASKQKASLSSIFDEDTESSYSTVDKLVSDVSSKHTETPSLGLFGRVKEKIASTYDYAKVKSPEMKEFLGYITSGSKKKSGTLGRMGEVASGMSYSPLQRLADSTAQSTALSILNTETGKKIASWTSALTKNLPLKAVAKTKSLTEGLSYDQEFQKLLEKRNDETNKWVEKVGYEIQDSGTQSLVGVALQMVPYIGRGLSTAYYTALSADEQIQSKGYVDNLGNIAVDVIGDQMLGDVVQSLFKKPTSELIKAGFLSKAKSVLVAGGEGFITEGSTEVAQTFLKYANDWRLSDDQDERRKIVEEAKKYISEGGLIMELVVGGVSGGVIAGGADVVSQSMGGTNVGAGAEAVQPSIQPTKNKPLLSGGGKREEEIQNALKEDIAQELKTSDTVSVARNLSEDMNIDYTTAKAIVDVVNKKEKLDTEGFSDEELQSEIDSILGGITGGSEVVAEDAERAKGAISEDTKDSIDETIESLPKEVQEEAKQKWEETVLPKLENDIQEIVDESGIEELNSERVDLEAKSAQGEDVTKEMKEITKKIKTTDEEIALKKKKLEMKTEENFIKEAKKTSVKTEYEKQDEPEEGYDRFNIKLDSGEEIFADFTDKGIGSSNGFVHIQFMSKNKKEPNPVSETGYRSHFVQADMKGMTDEEKIAEIKKSAEAFAREEATTRKKKTKEKTQKEKVEESLKDTSKTIKQISEETKILEPNVRRILGVGAKEGVFKRVEKGVYILSKDGKDIAYVETGDAVESLPRLAKEGFKADMVFLDIPYDTPAVKGGNRGVKYGLLSVTDFEKVVSAVSDIVRDEDAPVIHMYSQAESGMKKMLQYNNVLVAKGFKPVGKGQYQKTFADGSPVTSPNGKVSQPEGILVFTKSGELKKELGDLNFTLKRPKGYQTEKPAEMLKAMIEMTTEEGDTILDPFAGSGVTGAEAVRAGRVPYLIEKNAEVADTITIPRVESVSTEELNAFIKKGETDIKVGDVFNTGGVTNMESPVTVLSIEGRTVKFTDGAGTEFSGMEKSLVKKFLKEGAWTRADVDSTDDSGIVDTYGNRQESVPDSGEVPTGTDTESSGETPSDISGYDGATMLAESGDGFTPTGTPSEGIKGKKARQKINEEVEALLEAKNYSTISSEYTEEDRLLMSSYTGAGGKESAGAEGSGLLNEYYTPTPVIDKIWAIATTLQPDVMTAFEPSAGTGRFISNSPTEVKVDGAEISNVSGTIAQILNPDSEITIGDFQELFFDKKTNKQKEVSKYDMVVGNPPFGDRAGFLKGKGEESNINRQEEYFIKRGLDMVKEGGHLIYVVNSSFLKTGISKGKNAIAKIGRLVSAYRLPENVFEDTSIGTDIVVFKKETADIIAEGSRNLTLSDDRYFRATIGANNILGKTKVRKNRFGQTESYVEGTLDEALKKMQLPQAEKVAVKESTEKKTSTKKTTKKEVAKKPDTQKVNASENFSDLVHQTQSISNKSEYSQKELVMLKRIERDGSIPTPTPNEMPFLNYQGGKYFNDGLYFSGEIYQKLEKLQEDRREIIDTLGEEQYTKQKLGLESIIPKTIPISDISFDPLDRYIVNTVTKYGSGGNDTTILNAFSAYVRSPYSKVVLSPRVSKYDIIRYVGGERASKDSKPIMGKIKEDAKRLFNQYIQNELPQETKDVLEKRYNKEKNGFVLPDYTQIPLEIKDMAKQFRGQDFSLSETQKNGVGFLVNKGSGLIAYGVGVGKTHTLAVATVANMQKGWTKRPLFVVPKSTISETWIGTLKSMFPGIAINNLEGLQADVVKRLKNSRGEVKDWIKDNELTVISHEGLLRIGFNESELLEVAGDLNDAIWKEEKTKRAGEKQKSKTEEILGHAQKYVSDVMISDLGIDHVSVDEVHNFRKVFQGAKKEDDTPGGKKRYSNVLGGTPSRRAQQLFLISQYIQKRNGNRNVFLASATPFENHATEVYNILSFVARDRMKQMGIANINDFFSVFANFETELDRKLDGSWIDREKMKSFSNLQSLQGLLKEFIDYKEDPTLVRPDRRVITPHLQMSEQQEQNLLKIQELLTGEKQDTSSTQEEGGPEMFSEVESSDGEVEDGAFLKASTYSIANSVSPYFIKEYTKNPPTKEELVENSPKIKYSMELLKTVKNNPKTTDFGTFLFFGKMGVELHPLIKEYIVENLGYSNDQVAILSGKVTDEQKEDIKKRFNNGEVKVLIGGDQTKEGIDLQNNGFMTVNLALGWNPTQIAQVEGRIWRQGNSRSIAPLVYPLVENSGDAIIFNKFEEKGGRINDLFSYAGKMFDVSEVDPAEKRLALLTKPEDKAKMQIEIDKTQLYNERVLVENDINELRKTLADRNQTEKDIEEYKKDIEENTSSESRIREYKKELKNAQSRMERLSAKLEAYTDPEKQIGEWEASIVDLDIKIREINKTYEEKLALFNTQYKEDIKKRKTMKDHMAEIEGLIAELKERTPEELAELKREKIQKLEEDRFFSTPQYQRIEGDQELTIKTLEIIGDRETVSRQFVLDTTNRPELKQVEKDIVRKTLETMTGDTINVQELTEKIIPQLLPLTVKDVGSSYENVVLPDELRGNVANYNVNVYESPVKTSAGQIHFNDVMDAMGGSDVENYFGHTRIEDMADDQTRRVIEVQSDLYQKGNLEKEMAGAGIDKSITRPIGDTTPDNVRYQQLVDKQKAITAQRTKETAKLQQYNDPTAHFRMAREEVDKALKDGKTKLQFPTGETALAVEGLSRMNQWRVDTPGGDILEMGNLEVGMPVRTFADLTSWIVTEVIGDGKFKAVQSRELLRNDPTPSYSNYEKLPNGQFYPTNRIEQFDISGKVDTNSPIYKFYEKDLGRYLKNKYNAKIVTDSQGVTWFEVALNPEMYTGKVEAFLRKEKGKDKMVTFEQAKEKLEEYQKRLKFNFSIDFADVIFTGEFYKKSFDMINKVQAYAVTYNDKLTLIQNITETTADHDLTHIIVNNIEKIPIFKGITRKQLFKAQNGGKDYTFRDMERLNEELAIGFQNKLRGEKQSNIPDVIQRFYERLLIAFTDLFKALGGKVNPIQDFYRRVASGVAKESDLVELVSDESLDKEVKYTDENGRTIMDFGISRKIQERLDEQKMLFERIVEKSEQYSVNLRRKDINELDNLMAQSRDLYLKDKEEFKQADELMKIGDERRMKKGLLDQKFEKILSPYIKLKTGSREKVDKVLMNGDIDAREYQDYELRSLNLDAEQIEGYKSVRKAFNIAHGLLIEEMKKNGVKEEEIKTFEAERIGYMPHKWKYRFAIKTQKLQEGEDPRVSSSWKTETMDVFKSAREADKEFKKRTSENGDPTVRFVNDTLDNLDVDFFTEQRFSLENMKSVIAKAKTPQEVKDQLLTGVRNMVKEKGFGRNFIKRTGIKGYETKDVPTVISNYFSGLNGFVTKMEAGKKYYGVLETIDARRQKKFYSWVRDSIAYDMGQTKEWNALKQLAFVFYLTNDLSFLLTNATQNFTIGIGELSKIVPGIKSAYKGETALIKAMSDWTFKNISAEEKKAITGLLKLGRLGGEMTSELMGYKANPLYRSAGKAINKFLYATTSFVEQNVNRVPSFLAARRLLVEQGLTEKEANEKALEVSDDINFRYGKQHRPVLMRGKKSVLFVFNHYIRSYLYQLSRDMKNREFMSITKKLFYTTLLGGTLGLPFAKTILEIVKKIVGTDDDEVVEELNSWELALKRGLPASFANIDLSGRIGIDIVTIQNIMDAPDKVVSYLGALGNLLAERLPKGKELLSQGRFLEAGGKLIPDMLGNIAKAYQGYEYGVYSQAGNPLIDSEGDTFKYTTYEAWVKATGFTPTREQLAWDESARQWDLKAETADQSAEVRGKIKKALQNEDFETARSLQEAGREEGILSETKDYVKEAVKDNSMKLNIEKWQSSSKNQSTLDSLERNIARETYGDSFTKTQLTDITKEFAYRRHFGFDNATAEEIWKAPTNKEKAELLKKAREEMSLEEFRDFYNKGRREVTYDSGRSSQILISDNVKELYLSL